MWLVINILVDCPREDVDTDNDDGSDKECPKWFKEYNLRPITALVACALVFILTFVVDFVCQRNVFTTFALAFSLPPFPSLERF